MSYTYKSFKVNFARPCFKKQRVLGSLARLLSGRNLSHHTRGSKFSFQVTVAHA